MRRPITTSITLVAFAHIAVCSIGQSGSITETISLLRENDGHTWCAYKSPSAFKADVAAIKPTDSVRITYIGNSLSEMTYQLEAESGDWIVIDKYTPSTEDILVKRANLMAQINLEVIQEAVIRREVGSFKTLSVTTLDGKPADLANADLPAVPVKTNLLTQPFLHVSDEIRKRRVEKLCDNID